MSSFVNPIIKYIQQIIAISQNDEISISQAFANNNFIEITNSSDNIVPDNSTLYLISPFLYNNVYILEQTLTCLQNGFGVPLNVPFNYESQKISNDQVSIKNIKDLHITTTACNTFSSSSLELNELILNKYWNYPITERGGYYEYGLTEFNTFSNESGLSDIITYLKTLPTSVNEYNTLQYVLEQFVNGGFAAFNYNDTLYAGTPAGFCNWY